MYYSMNSMKEQLTTNGVIMSNGEIIGTDVHVNHNTLDNSIRYTYDSESGMMSGSCNINTQTTIMYDRYNKINGLLSNKPDPSSDWLIFWNNE